MDKLKQLIDQLQEKIDALSLRERAVLFLAISFALFTAVDYLLLSPLESKQQNLLGQIQKIQSENSQLEGQALNIINRYKADPNLAERQQLARIKSEIDDASEQIEDAVAGLISPNKMALALENLLQRQKSLKFISIDSLPAEPLLQSVATEGEQSSTTVEGIPAQSIYRHSFKLRFEGSYLDTLAYLKELESLQWSFRWDEIDIATIEYPTVTISLVLHTISLDEGLIGV